MLAGDVNVSAPDAALQHAPEAFDGVGMGNAVNPFIRGMIDRAMFVAELL